MSVQVTASSAPVKVAAPQTEASLQPANNVALIDPNQFQKSQVESQLSSAEQAKLVHLADTLVNVNVRDERQKLDRTQSIEGIGSAAAQKAAAMSKMLDSPIRNLAQAGMEGSPVANALIGLKTKVDELNPNGLDLSEPGFVGRMFGKLPFVGNKLNRYFTQYQSGASVIDSVLVQLKNGVRQLENDNRVIVDDKIRMAETNRELENVIAKALYLDKVMEEKAMALLEGSEERTFVDNELLFPLRQRIKDLQTQLAVNQQGILSLEIVRKNNLELIRGARRCENVTFMALKVAVQVAFALAHQRIVLKTIEAVDETTTNLMLQNAKNLREQGTAIHKQAVNQGISIETLRQSFNDIEAAYDDLENFRKAALPVMAEQMSELSTLTGRAAKTIERIERGSNTRVDLLDGQFAVAS